MIILIRESNKKYDYTLLGIRISYVLIFILEVIVTPIIN